MDEQELIDVMNAELNLELPARVSFAELRLRLQAAVRTLVETDFQQLIFVLYRVDVNERKLKYLLQENVGEEAAIIIADLIIERQAEKITSRKQFREFNDDTTDGAERW